MQVGSLVQSNVDGQIGIIIEVFPSSAKDWRTKYRVLFPDLGFMWLSSQVLDLIKK